MAVASLDRRDGGLGADERLVEVAGGSLRAVARTAGNLYATAESAATSRPRRTGMIYCERSATMAVRQCKFNLHAASSRVSDGARQRLTPSAHEGGGAASAPRLMASAAHRWNPL